MLWTKVASALEGYSTLTILLIILLAAQVPNFVNPMALNKDIMPFYNKKIHGCGYNLNILWSPLKNRMPKNLTIYNFGHIVPESWLRPCSKSLLTSTFRVY